MKTRFCNISGNFVVSYVFRLVIIYVMIPESMSFLLSDTADSLYSSSDLLPQRSMLPRQSPAHMAAQVLSSTDFEWDARNPPIVCIDIPRNLTLCSGIGYTKMRLPNLLEHDTLQEVSHQAASWVPLLNIGCHVDTRRFICSLFCPVCLDVKIYPCRSLCEKVKSGCEARMKTYGFPWPDMFACDLFPQDNDMCITSEIASTASGNTDGICKVCEQANTMENILDHYCQATFALRIKLRKTEDGKLSIKKTKIFKAENGTKKVLDREEIFPLKLLSDCCQQKLTISNYSTYFLMGTLENGVLTPTFIMPWMTRHSKSFKKSIKMLRTLNCSDPTDITHTVISPSIMPPRQLPSSPPPAKFLPFVRLYDHPYHHQRRKRNNTRETRNKKHRLRKKKKVEEKPAVEKFT